MHVKNYKTQIVHDKMEHLLLILQIYSSVYNQSTGHIIVFLLSEQVDFNSSPIEHIVRVNR